MNEAYIRSLHLKNFRCFSGSKFDFDAPIVLIEGANGSGKTSLLEALHYTSYMRSFRASTPRDLIQFGSESFYISAVFNDHTINVGVLSATANTTKRQIKIDQTTITSYKELRDYSRLITITEDDLMLIKGGPEKRRLFIDHGLLLINDEAFDMFKLYQEVLNNRNALLVKEQVVDPQEILFWTQKLWDLSLLIQEQRKNLVTLLSNHALKFLAKYWPDYQLLFAYQAKEQLNSTESFDAFYSRQVESGFFDKERRYRRSLFGAHLDDIEITFGLKSARHYSSRGQQKLIVILLKLALVEYLLQSKGQTAFLLDDFTTDFDATVVEKIMSLLLTSKAQLIFVSPLINGSESLFFTKHAIAILKISL